MFVKDACRNDSTSFTIIRDELEKKYFRFLFYD